MYAAAGGASLASRQARQRQRQKQLQQLKNQKELKPHQPKQYHNYTDDGGPPKLSRVERGALRPPQVGPHERRHSASNYHLKEPPKSRLKESPSISIPVQSRPSLVENHVSASPSLQLPQIFIPEGDGRLERRCSFVRQVEEMEKCPEGGLLDKCNHLCNFEIKDRMWDNKYEFERDFYGSLDYPFSECSQGRAAWQERERGRRCSLSEEARQSRIKQSEAHHRWMKRNRIHDSTYGTGSDDDDFFSVYHQSAAANALLYVGLGTTAIGSVIFFVGTGEKGFKTLELRLIGPTLIACGLLCCLIRVLLCACPSTCLRRRKKTRLKTACPHTSRYPKTRDHVDSTALLTKNKKKVSIVPPSQPQPSTSTEDKITLPQINLPPEDSVIELQNLELIYDIQSVSSNDSDDNATTVVDNSRTTNDLETCLSVVIERSDNSESSDGIKNQESSDKQTHSGIVLSPLQLGQ
ncbi:uncharacterized protein LOC123016342 isoform X1 [Tribolium madens]|uniref:uncharacterized protein LOC123016342 isoform X1 n=1 Tax=Tribolium madens TaxID=41895 RepID=UPI001CF75491|nr:uncharacterized protein LOC123016342 isoform X1 [Tribolium madens]XP_044272619.1 uncharacterized protein LOC123016342 isoform X1 [Tribolium madens]XP_044272620.1 uncharacterized protein LOC123016342 isoform X1 [Tribolium madens]XP_044272621.1 uncharacterized protein LOC123016342 isoform X1 [Tribolium madens]